MTRAAYYALHYGIEYLEWSVRSVADVVDVICIAYSPRPTCGTDAKTPVPMGEDELNLIDAVRRGVRGGRAKLVWRNIQGQRFFEYGHHCDLAQRMCADFGADVAVNVDADEVWDPQTLEEAFALVEARATLPDPVRRYTVPFAHFWRSLRWVCYDNSHPIRLHNLRVLAQPETALEHLDLALPVFHFGYAQREAVMRYKWEIHGHRRELRPGWLDETFLGWTPGAGDVHPVMVDGFWNPERADRYGPLLKHLLEDHPYLATEVIR